ncbi:MAG: radical SAM protein [Oscillospiraceae bacterium]|jgi:putative pyruvate formate lyase activating enzyme|nr:radical SAM protein [Oscillospiraceae bacterium]
MSYKLNCNLCPKNCNALRTQNSGKGFCGMGLKPVVARAAPHHWEEPVISGTNGSGAVFFSGCTLGCVFCQNHEISTQGFGKALSCTELAQVFKGLEAQGVHNINLVSGTHFVPRIIKALELYRPQIPIVWNSSGYEKSQTINALADYVDIWLPDFKYALSPAAMKYSGAEDYPKIAQAAIDAMLELSPTPIIENDIMKKGVIIRHLILPENTLNSIEVLNIVNKRYKGRALFSLMAQYTPHGNISAFRELKRKITRREYDKLCGVLFELGLEGFVQELTAADEGFIPAFDLSGL